MSLFSELSFAAQGLAMASLPAASPKSEPERFSRTQESEAEGPAGEWRIAKSLHSKQMPAQQTHRILPTIF